MISSLANFLMLVMYRGGQPGRVSWTLLMFTMGAVGIARVAIEKDRMYSLGYAGILGMVTFVSMLKFVDSPIFSAIILVVIAYLADRITRDCTLIDDEVDASGQGLVDSGRLFVKKQIKSPVQEGPGGVAIDATATKGKPAHQPGRTVLYLALGALPLFGIGQFFLHQDPETWSRAQKLLAFYLFASLSLLVTTSFLGLRRYLRQRKVDMPSDVSVAWLSGGAALIALILFIAFMAPVPGQWLASFELPAFLDSPGDTVASKQGWGEDGADKTSDGASSTSEDQNPSDKEVEDITPGQNAPAGDVGDGKRDDGPAGKQKGNKKGESGDNDSGESKQPPPSDQKQDGQKSDQQKQEGQKSAGEKSEGQKSDGEKSEADESDAQKSDPPQTDKADGAEQPPLDESNEKQPDEKSESDPKQSPPKNDSPPPKQNPNQAAGQPKPSASPPSSNPAQSIADAMPGISDMLKFIIFVALAAIVATFVYLNRHALALWWSNLFARGPIADKSTFDEFLSAETRVPPRSFSSFVNPIGKETDPRRVIVITFSAWEAWCRENGISRARDETPSEFLSRVAAATGSMTAPATRVVDAYNRIVYGRGNASEQDVAAADQVWRSMA
ncbi:hypothetical protein Poly51_25940 [Rubripirellula tenax]|uniref:Protein-glutamine gamma-glutamyltransferase-like C-terminal domain-containing protein n=1 Tax=Rubripirellula tenax TaxID=2528015 RepID=A0A5C6F8I6_9BACT|nr:DUF4129 domain-containing protein [Rubripirellula tenax]TWU56677.1 hypothetical protein Poly51_25940 [Rubripirellula tenax]